jgi:hypothetical protein
MVIALPSPVHLQWHPTLADVIDFVFMEDHGCVLTVLTHHVEEQIRDAFVDSYLLIGRGSIRTRRGSLTGDQDVYDGHWSLQRR